MKNTASRCRGYFYPRSPCGERRLSYFYIIKITQFLSTLSLRRATIPDREPAAGYLISIHALLAESDPTRWAPTCRISNFYPRSPCGERPSLLYSSSCIHRFLSTLSLRRATVHYDNYNLHCVISIHALLAESDGVAAVQNGKGRYFYPRSPCGERPAMGNPTLEIAYFYPRSPCGERPVKDATARSNAQFLSTLSLRRATTSRVYKILADWDFYPRSPCGERLGDVERELRGIDISIHALLAESDGRGQPFQPGRCISIHALLAESDRIAWEANQAGKISIHALLAESDRAK